MPIQRSGQEVSVHLTVRGVQDTEVQLHHPGTDSAVVAVRIGRAALLYFRDRDTATAFHRNWVLFSTQAAGLRMRSSSNSPSNEPVSAAAAIDVVNVPRMSGGLEQRAGTANHLIIRFGRLSIAVMDREAYLSIKGALTQARDLAGENFPLSERHLQLAAMATAERALAAPPTRPHPTRTAQHPAARRPPAPHRTATSRARGLS